ncbi:MAG: EscU/YscU/HrcU family type III secretion system export apparatus switch protein, partial [Casimicrobium sp.]
MSQGEEKKFPPSAKKIRNARAEGQVARSAELGPSLRFIVLGFVIALLVPIVFQQVGALFNAVLRDIASLDAGHRVGALALYTTSVALKFVLVIVSIAALVGVLADFIQIGPNFASKAKRFQLSRLNPIDNFKRIFSGRSVMRLLIGAMKFFIAGIICVLVIVHYTGDLLLSSRGEFQGVLDLAVQIAIATFFWSCVLLGVLAAADFAYERHHWYKELFMTR